MRVVPSAALAAAANAVPMLMAGMATALEPRAVRKNSTWATSS